MKPSWILLFALFLSPLIFSAERPNIVFVFCDDLGYGDIHCLAPETSKIPTPHTDRLAQEGMIFTDAHSGSSVCTPTRYGLLTGRYSWRTKLQKGVVTGFAPCLIDEARPTVASFLQDQGYATAIIGKWHLDFQYADPDTGTLYSQKDHKTPPVGARIPDGPLTRGFDFFHGFHHARNMEAVIVDDQVIAQDPVENMLPRLTEQSVAYITSRAESEDPFFLYVPLGSPHTPIVPTEEWQGKSGLGDYGDFVMQTDHALGEILRVLDETGMAEETLVIFSSDNGCSKAAGIKDLAEQGHLVSAHLRGSKADIWEGGHRVPFIVRWPGQVKAGSTNDATLCLVDFFATTAELIGEEVPTDSCEDSVSFLAALSGDEIKSERPGIVHHSHSGHFAYRSGPWKLNLARASGGWTKPQEKDATDEMPIAQLYHLGEDIGETNNLFETRPEVAARLYRDLHQIVFAGRSTPGEPSPNDVDEIDLWKSEKAVPDWAEAAVVQKDPASPPAAEKPRAPEDRPNFLFILVDDQSPFDFKFYNPRSTLDAPVIEGLAREGLVIDGAYHMGADAGAVCRPSRHMIMTGRTLWNLRTPPKNGDPPYQDEVQEQIENCLPAIFNRAGYDTMRTCKRGNSYPPANRQFAVVHDATKRKGDPETGSQWHADRVLDYLAEREASDDEDPFFIYYGFSHPHDPREGPAALLEKYHAVNHSDQTQPVALNRAAPPLPINYLSAHPFPDGHPNLRDEVAVKGVWEWRDEATIRNEIGRQFACSESIDIQVGRVIDQLEAMGELDNTYIIYTADHGMAIGRHGLQGKQNLYEHTWRVPFVVKGPGVKTGRAQGNLYLLDLLGTFCDLAGIDLPPSVESVSFRSVLEGSEESIRDVLYGAYCGGTKPGIRAIREGDWKMIQYDAIDGAVQETQLFNLAENPHEFLSEHGEEDEWLTDLAENPTYRPQLKRLQQLLLEEMRRLGDPHRLWDQPQD
ncbi:MAG: sulfatase-like hydrolase/transferase [Verrucomicrobiota bacterium]